MPFTTVRHVLTARPDVVPEARPRRAPDADDGRSLRHARRGRRLAGGAALPVPTLRYACRGSARGGAAPCLSELSSASAGPAGGRAAKPARLLLAAFIGIE